MKKLNEVHWMLLVSALLILSSLGITLWNNTQHRALASTQTSSSETEVVNEPIQPIPLHIDLNQDKVALGKQLFHDTRFSRDNSVSCASCHVLNKGGVDLLQLPVGVNGTKGVVNTPTVFNSGFNFRQFWDGRAQTLELQVPGPIHNPLEMKSNWDEVLAKLKASPDYVTAFAALYSDGITTVNIVDAIATYERSLYTPNSRFDQFLRGDTSSITIEEAQGYRLFRSYGCATCHQGVNVGGNMFQRMGIVADYFEERGNITEADLGLLNITEKLEDQYVFKVPSLRLVTLTPPYMHDGSVPTLEGAIEVMAYYQLGRSIPDSEIGLIAQFLKTLVGQNPELASG
jgi:cytochrome c peroxidase